MEFTKGVETSEEGYSYTIGYGWKILPMTYCVVARLPQDHALLSTSENARIYIQDEALHLKWFKVLENSFQTKITFEYSPRKAPEEAFPYVALVAICVILLLVSGTILKVRAARRPKEAIPREVLKPEVPKKEVERVLKLLTDHERKVIKELLRKDKLTQRALCDRTGIPKATMSRVLKRLEGKGVVARVGHGFRKQVMLTRWSRRWKHK